MPIGTIIFEVEYQVPHMHSAKYTQNPSSVCVMCTRKENITINDKGSLEELYSVLFDTQDILCLAQDKQELDADLLQDREIALRLCKSMSEEVELSENVYFVKEASENMTDMIHMPLYESEDEEYCESVSDPEESDASTDSSQTYVLYTENTDINTPVTRILHDDTLTSQDVRAEAYINDSQQHNVQIYAGKCNEYNVRFKRLSLSVLYRHADCHLHPYFFGGVSQDTLCAYEGEYSIMYNIYGLCSRTNKLNVESYAPYGVVRFGTKIFGLGRSAELTENTVMFAYVKPHVYTQLEESENTILARTHIAHKESVAQHKESFFNYAIYFPNDIDMSLFIRFSNKVGISDLLIQEARMLEGVCNFTVTMSERKVHIGDLRVVIFYDYGMFNAYFVDKQAREDAVAQETIARIVDLHRNVHWLGADIYHNRCLRVFPRVTMRLGSFEEYSNNNFASQNDDGICVRDIVYEATCTLFRVHKYVNDTMPTSLQEESMRCLSSALDNPLYMARENLRLSLSLTHYMLHIYAETLSVDIKRHQKESPHAQNTHNDIRIKCINFMLTNACYDECERCAAFYCELLKHSAPTGAHEDSLQQFKLHIDAELQKVRLIPHDMSYELTRASVTDEHTATHNIDVLNIRDVQRCIERELYMTSELFCEDMKIVANINYRVNKHAFGLFVAGKMIAEHSDIAPAALYRRTRHSAAKQLKTTVQHMNTFVRQQQLRTRGIYNGDIIDIRTRQRIHSAAAESVDEDDAALQACIALSMKEDSTISADIIKYQQTIEQAYKTRNTEAHKSKEQDELNILQSLMCEVQLDDSNTPQGCASIPHINTQKCRAQTFGTFNINKKGDIIIPLTFVERDCNIKLFESTRILKLHDEDIDTFYESFSLSDRATIDRVYNMLVHDSIYEHTARMVGENYNMFVQRLSRILEQKERAIHTNGCLNTSCDIVSDIHTIRDCQQLAKYVESIFDYALTCTVTEDSADIRNIINHLYETASWFYLRTYSELRKITETEHSAVQLIETARYCYVCGDLAYFLHCEYKRLVPLST